MSVGHTLQSRVRSWRQLIVAQKTSPEQLLKKRCSHILDDRSETSSLAIHCAKLVHVHFAQWTETSRCTASTLSSVKLESDQAMLLLIIALLGGSLTIVSPCILPVLPFIFARADRPFLTNGLPTLLAMAATLRELPLSRPSVAVGPCKPTSMDACWLWPCWRCWE